MPEITYPFTTAGNYAYDLDKINIDSGEASLLTHPEITCYTDFNTDGNPDLEYSLGTDTGTESGTVSVSGGELDLTSAGTVTYSATDNADTQQVGTIRIGVKPNYTGIPAQRRVYFAIGQNSGNNNLILFQHNTTGNTSFQIKDSSGSSIVVHSFSWSPTSGTEYELEFNFDITNGETRIFLDGVQQGSTLTGTGTRSSDITKLILGSVLASTVLSNFSITFFEVFNAVQHTANYTPGETTPRYSKDNPTVIPNSGFYADGLNSFTATTTETGSDLVKFTVQVDGTEKYWDGAAWSNSSGYSESNTEAEVNTNAGSLDISTGALVKITSYLHSETGLTTPDLDEFTVDYDYFNPPDPSPDICLVNGRLLDANSNAISGAIVEANITNTSSGAFIDSNNYWVTGNKISTTTNSNGYFELTLIRSGEYTGTVVYDFTITETDSTNQYVIENRIIPDQTTADFNDLLEQE